MYYCIVIYVLAAVLTLGLMWHRMDTENDWQESPLLIVLLVIASVAWPFIWGYALGMVIDDFS